MPRSSLFTNVPSSAVEKSQLLKALTAAAAKSIGKDESKFATLFHADTPIYFAGSEEPAAFCEVASIGKIGGEKNQTISAELAAVVQQHLNIAADRFYINFFDLAASDWGFKGTTAKALRDEGAADKD